MRINGTSATSAPSARILPAASEPLSGARVSMTRTPESGRALLFVPLRDGRERFAQIALEIAVESVDIEQALQRAGFERIL